MFAVFVHREIKFLTHLPDLKRLQTEDYEHLINMEKVYNVKLTFRADPSYHMENFRIIVSNH